MAWAPCGVFWGLSCYNRKRRGHDVTCETLVGVESGDSVEFKNNTWQLKKQCMLTRVMARLRDGYVNCMVNAANRGDMSHLVYGNHFPGQGYRFEESHYCSMFEMEVAAQERQKSYRSNLDVVYE